MPYRSLVNTHVPAAGALSSDLPEPDTFDGTGSGALLGAVAGGVLGFLVGNLISDAPSEDKTREAMSHAGIGALGGAVIGGFLAHGAYVEGYEAAARMAARKSA